MLVKQSNGGTQCTARLMQGSIIIMEVHLTRHSSVILKD